jgi:cystathionine beta-synthase
MQAVKQLSKQMLFDKNSNVVMIFCDHGSRYMSKIYSDKWMYDQGFFDSEKTALEKPIEYIK